MNYQFTPWIALGISIVFTTIIWLTILDLEKQSQELEFIALADKMTLQIQGKLQTHEQVLMGFQGLFASSYEVTPNEFINFFNIQQITNRFPDSQGVGFIEYVSGEEEKIAFYEKLEKYDIKFTIHPEGTRTKYYPVTYLEPHDFRNTRALGYDVYTEEIRRQSVDEAINTGQTTITGKITLVQEVGKDIQNGFLMLLPVYGIDDTTDQVKLQGLVYSVFRMNDFVEGIWDTEIFKDIEIKIYDSPTISENLFFDSTKIDSNSKELLFSHSQVIEFGHKQWFFTYSGTLPMVENPQNIRWLIPIMGYVMSLVLFYALLLLVKNMKLTKEMIKKERTSALGELAGRFSHDIRNPLSNINMALNLIQKDNDFASNEKVREKFQIISTNLERISHQVDDVLDFIRIHPIEKEELSLNSLIGDCIASITIPKNIKIDSPQKDLSFFGDPFQLQIAFKNILSNSIQAIGAKTGKITIRSKEDSNHLFIEFEDSGPGFVGLKNNEIFELLKTTKQTGTGLGLVSCKQIIENHKGSISVRENPTTFIIKIPKK
ncbi:MAG: CHASE domain-containing protein [Nitrosopumilaceae archaeon]